MARPRRRQSRREEIEAQFESAGLRRGEPFPRVDALGNEDRLFRPSKVELVMTPADLTAEELRAPGFRVTPGWPEADVNWEGWSLPAWPSLRLIYDWDRPSHTSPLGSLLSSLLAVEDQDNARIVEFAGQWGMMGV